MLAYAHATLLYQSPHAVAFDKIWRAQALATIPAASCNVKSNHDTGNYHPERTIMVSFLEGLVVFIDTSPAVFTNVCL